MEKTEMIEMLQELVQADIDAVHTYDQVLDEISDRVVRSQLLSFRDQHLDHIAAISDEIQALGGPRPEMTKDLKDHVLEAVALLRTAAGGMKSALKVLKGTEEITSRRYSTIISREMPPEVKDMLRRHFSDEKIHFEYINENEKVI